MTARRFPELSATEETVALARLRVEGLAEALHTEPIDRVTYAELAEYLDGPGWRACDALDELRALPTAAAISRIADVLAGTKYAESSPDSARTRPGRPTS